MPSGTTNTLCQDLMANHAGVVQVIVVIVGNEHDIDRRQITKAIGGGSTPRGLGPDSGKWERRARSRKDR